MTLSVTGMTLSVTGVTLSVFGCTYYLRVNIFYRNIYFISFYYAPCI